MARNRKRELTLEEHKEIGKDVQSSFYMYGKHINTIYARFSVNGREAKLFRKVYDSLMTLKSLLDTSFFQDHPDQAAKNSPYYGSPEKGMGERK